MKKDKKVFILGLALILVILITLVIFNSTSKVEQPPSEISQASEDSEKRTSSELESSLESSKEQQSTITSEFPKESVPDTSINEPSTEENSEASGTSETSENLESSASIIDNIDKDKVAYYFSVNLLESEIAEYKIFIKSYFDKKVYSLGDTIDCKEEISTLVENEDPSKFYKVFAAIYSAWNFSRSPRIFDEVDITFNPFAVQYKLDEENNIILRYSDNLKITLSVYFEGEFAHFLAMK